MQLTIRLINLLVSIVELVLGFRFFMRIFGANPAAPFVRWIYDNSQPILYPFRGIFPPEVINGGYVFEFTTLFAMVAYAVLGFLIIELMRLIHASVKNQGGGLPLGKSA